MFKVLFCGQEFAKGFQYTAEALQTDTGVQVQSCAKSDVPAQIEGAHVAVPLAAKLDATTLARAKQLRLVIQYGVGTEGVDIPEATRLGIWVSNIPSKDTGNALSCAEHAIYLTLAVLRKQAAMAQSLHQRTVGVPVGEVLYGKVVLLVGFGNIAKELVPRLKAFGVRLLAVRRSPWRQEADSDAEQLLDEKGGWQDLEAFASQADIMILACSQNEQTRGMVNSQLLASCKAGLRIINVTRGGLLDYDAVKAALDAGRLGGLGLDVQWREPFEMDDPIAQHPKVVLTPHIAGVTELSYRNMAKVVAAEVRRCRQGLRPSLQLNSPQPDRLEPV